MGRVLQDIGELRRRRLRASLPVEVPSTGSDGPQGLRAVRVQKRAFLFLPAVTFAVADNMEAQALASVKSGQTLQPCRVCVMPLH